MSAKEVAAFFQTNKVPSLIAFVWIFSLFTFVVIKVFTNISAITTAVNVAFGSFISLIPLTIALLRWRRTGKWDEPGKEK